MKTIPLTNSLDVAVVSDEDYERAMGYSWFLKRSGSGDNYYIATSIRIGDKVRTLRLHALIACPAVGQDVHHIHHNPFDNRREELKCINHKEHGYEIKRWLSDKGKRNVKSCEMV